MRSFCLLTSIKLILIPNCSLLYLHSNDTYVQFQKFIIKKGIATNLIAITKYECVSGGSSAEEGCTDTNAY